MNNFFEIREKQIINIKHITLIGQSFNTGSLYVKLVTGDIYKISEKKYLELVERLNND